MIFHIFEGFYLSITQPRSAFGSRRLHRTDIPNTKGSAQPILSGNYDGFITKMNADLAIIKTTYLGGSGIDSSFLKDDYISSIVTDSTGSVFVSGHTSSNLVTKTNIKYDFPYAFVTKLNSGLTKIEKSIYLDVTTNEKTHIVSDSTNLYVVGTLLDLGVETTRDQSQYNTVYDVFIANLDRNLSNVVLTCLDKSDDDLGTSVAITKNGLHISGLTNVNKKESSLEESSVFITKLNPLSSKVLTSNTKCLRLEPSSFSQSDAIMQRIKNDEEKTPNEIIKSPQKELKSDAQNIKKPILEKKETLEKKKQNVVKIVKKEWKLELYIPNKYDITTNTNSVLQIVKKTNNSQKQSIMEGILIIKDRTDINEIDFGLKCNSKSSNTKINNIEFSITNFSCTPKTYLKIYTTDKYGGITFTQMKFGGVGYLDDFMKNIKIKSIPNSK